MWSRGLNLALPGLLMHRNCEIRNANYEVCGSLLCSHRKQVQPQLLRILQLEIVPELLLRASQASILYRTPSSSELLRDRQKELLSVKSCSSGHLPLEDGQAAGPEERLWNVIQCAPRFPPLRRIRLHLWKGPSSFHFLPLHLPLRLRVAQLATGRPGSQRQVFWHPHQHSQHYLNVHWVKARSHPWTTIIIITSPWYPLKVQKNNMRNYPAFLAYITLVVAFFMIN